MRRGNEWRTDAGSVAPVPAARLYPVVTSAYNHHQGNICYKQHNTGVHTERKSTFITNSNAPWQRADVVRLELVRYKHTYQNQSANSCSVNVCMKYPALGRMAAGRTAAADRTSMDADC